VRRTIRMGGTRMLAERPRFAVGRRPILFVLPPGSAPDARAYFLLLRQKKVAKEKATPESTPGCAGFPPLLGKPGGCGTRPCGPQTVLADYPRPACVARRLQGGPRKASRRKCHGKNRLLRSTGKNAHFLRCQLFRDRCSGPLERRRATQALAEKGRGLSEGRSPEFRSPRQRRVAQGSPRSGPPTQGRLLLWLLSSWRSKKKVCPRVRRGNQRSSK
jgi:hypothetical protein